MGSEMCIRDRDLRLRRQMQQELRSIQRTTGKTFLFVTHDQEEACLLYTSDAADERSSVDLGGRRIIKKKTREHTRSTWTVKQAKQATEDETCT